MSAERPPARVPRRSPPRRSVLLLIPVLLILLAMAVALIVGVTRGDPDDHPAGKQTGGTTATADTLGMPGRDTTYAVGVNQVAADIQRRGVTGSSAPVPGTTHQHRTHPGGAAPAGSALGSRTPR